jgi:hypothetical protein
MGVCKVRHRGGYGTVAATVMLDESLSSDARFLVAMVSVLPADWKFFIGWLLRKTGWGKNKLQKVMKEMVNAGHLERERRHVNGLYEWEYTFLIGQEPYFEALENEALEFQAIQSQAIENRANNIINMREMNTKPDNTTTKRGVVVEMEKGAAVAGFDLDALLRKEMES